MSAPNGCVVLTAPLSAAVRFFIYRRNLDQPWSDGAVGFVGPLEWLAGESGLDEETIRTVSRNRYRTTKLATADALAQALGHPEWFYDGTLTILPNSLSSSTADLNELAA